MVLFLLLPCARRRSRLLARWQLRRPSLHLCLSRSSLCMRLCLALQVVIESALAGTCVHDRLPYNIRQQQQDHWDIQQLTYGASSSLSQCLKEACNHHRHH